MRRNFLYRYRHWILTLLELALPICFVWMLVAIKNAFGGDDGASETIPASTPDNVYDVYRPLSFLDYVTTLQVPRICEKSEYSYISFDDDGNFSSSYAEDGNSFYSYYGDPFDISGMPYGSSDWQNPFVRCDNRLCNETGQDAQPFCEYSILAIAPYAQSSEAALGRAKAFYAYLESEYPVIFDSSSLPFDFDFVRLFDSQDQLEFYVTSPSYGSPDRPKVAMAVVWDEGNVDNQYSYALRQNSTGSNVPEEGRAGALTTPDTARILDDFAVDDDSCPVFPGAPFYGNRQYSCTGQYLYNGIITFQKLVGDFILQDSGANVRVADHGIRFVPFPTKEYEAGGFFSIVARTFHDEVKGFLWVSQVLFLTVHTLYR